MTDKGSLIVISGPSGSGKGTILSYFNENFKDEKSIYSISATTRGPRVNEAEGVNYYYITKEEFESRIKDDGFLEYATYCGNYYGTPKKNVYDALEKGIDVILEIETVGAMKVKKACPEAVMVFILPPSLEELRNRLTGRGTETQEVIEERMQAAIKEMQLAPDYDYVIVNDVASKAAEKFNTILMSQRLTTNNNKKTIQEVLKK